MSFAVNSFNQIPPIQTLTTPSNTRGRLTVFIHPLLEILNEA
jgi:hypothetical protein